MTRYDWHQIQEAYDAGSSWRDLYSAFGVTSQALQNAKRDGRFVSDRTRSEAMNLALRAGKCRSTPSEEFRRALSQRQSLQNSGGRCKWFEVAGQKVQGTWERDVAEKLETLGVTWYKPKVGRDVWSYELNGRTRSYTPDIYLPDFDLYLEIKGYWWGDDKAKMAAVLEQHPDKKVLMILKEDYEKILQGDEPWKRA